MNLEIIVTFALIQFLLVISPGPNGVLFLKTVPTYGKRSGMGNLLGIFTATYAHGALSFFGLSAIILSSATLFTAIKISGAVYLAYLGIKSLLSVIKTKKTEENKVTECKVKKLKKRTDLSSFLEGFLTQILNPKVSMFYLAAFPQLIDFKNSAITDIFLLVSIHSFTIFIWFTCFIFILGKSSKVMQSNSIQKFIQSFTGSLFLYFSYKILSVDSKN